jgi:hypothetical protein
MNSDPRTPSLSSVTRHNASVDLLSSFAFLVIFFSFFIFIFLRFFNLLALPVKRHLSRD